MNFIKDNSTETYHVEVIVRNEGNEPSEVTKSEEYFTYRYVGKFHCGPAWKPSSDQNCCLVNIGSKVH